MQTGTVSRLRFCRRSWRLKINIRWTLVHSRKSHVRAKKLVVCARNRLLFHTVLQKLKSSLLMQVNAWMEFPLLIFGIWLLKCCILLPTNQRKSKEKMQGKNVQGDLLRDKSSSKHTNIQTKNPIQHDDLEICNVDHVSSNVKSS